MDETRTNSNQEENIVKIKFLKLICSLKNNTLNKYPIIRLTIEVIKYILEL